MELFTVQNIEFCYPEENKCALREVSFSVEKGEFVLLAGATGCGKTTLLRLLKPQLAPRGQIRGSLRFCGEDISSLPSAESAQRIGFVMQRTEEQLVTDKVWHELAFGLENCGVPPEVIRRRVAETAGWFGIEDWFDRKVSDLSGGEKQILSLAAVMVMDPEVLLLDEPTSQLDPVAAKDFLERLRKLNVDFSVTILLVEHRYSEVLPMTDRLLVMKEGTILSYGEPREVLMEEAAQKELADGLPFAAKLFQSVENKNGKCPLSVREGRSFVEDFLERKGANALKQVLQNLKQSEPNGATLPKQVALSLKGIYFRYEKDGKDALCGADLAVHEGEIVGIVGGNGSGKSTLLGVAAGLRRAYAGEVKVFGKKLRSYHGQELYQGCLSMLPQDVQTLFLYATVEEELAGIRKEEGLMSSLLEQLEPHHAKHPYDLSGGEQQLLALTKVLAAKPRLLLLDEPTKGLDATWRAELSKLLRALRAEGVTLVVVTHDIEWASGLSDTLAMCFRGEIISVEQRDQFLAENRFYTTEETKILRGLIG